MKSVNKIYVVLLVVVLVFGISGCSQSAAPVEEVVEEAVEALAEESVKKSVEGSAGEESLTQDKREPSLQVVASFYPYYDLARYLGGELVEVHQMMPAGAVFVGRY